jgi:hypothetical protein
MNAVRLSLSSGQEIIVYDTLENFMQVWQKALRRRKLILVEGERTVYVNPNAITTAEVWKGSHGRSTPVANRATGQHGHPPSAGSTPAPSAQILDRADRAIEQGGEG